MVYEFHVMSLCLNACPQIRSSISCTYEFRYVMELDVSCKIGINLEGSVNPP
jgi:hypothetical protein